MYIKITSFFLFWWYFTFIVTITFTDHNHFDRQVRVQKEQDGVLSRSKACCLCTCPPAQLTSRCMRKCNRPGLRTQTCYLSGWPWWMRWQWRRWRWQFEAKGGSQWEQWDGWASTLGEQNKAPGVGLVLLFWRNGIPEPNHEPKWVFLVSGSVCAHLYSTVLFRSCSFLFSTNNKFDTNNIKSSTDPN